MLCCSHWGFSYYRKYKEQKVVGFHLESQMASCCVQVDTDLCKLFMQLHGILFLFWDSVVATIIAQIHKSLKTCKEIILDSMIHLEKIFVLPSILKFLDV